LTLAAASWIAYCLAGAARFGRRWAPSDPWAETVIALGEQSGDDFAGLAKSVLGVSAIFGTDLASPQLSASIGAHLRGLLAGDARAYLTGIAAHGEGRET
jgi:mannitol-1-phosphate/altronate dehydrogenase